MIRARLEEPYREDVPYRFAVVNVTNHCNLRCAHCFVYREGNPNEVPASIRSEMGDEAILETLAGLRERHGLVGALWMGGEPLLRRRLLERGLPLFRSNIITTNGTVPLADFGSRALYVVSLDGPEDVNDAVRGSGVHARVLRNLARLPEGFATPVQVQCTVTRRNQHRLEELVESLRGTRVGWMTFSFYVPRREDHGPDAWPDNEARAGAVQEVLRLRRRHPDFVRNSRRALELMLPPHASRVTARCPAREQLLPLYMEGEGFRTPFCCYGNDVDCERCGAWVVFHLAARLGTPGELALAGRGNVPASGASGAGSGERG